MFCPHSLDQREASVYTEGLCPLCLCAKLERYRIAIEQTKSDAKVIAELNVAIADRNLEIEGDMKVIAALMEALKMVYSAYNMPAWLDAGQIEELPHAMAKLKVIIDANEQKVGDFKCSE